MKRRREYPGFKHKLPNEFFTYKNKTWEIIHKTTLLAYAVQLNKKGIAQGEILRFPVKGLVTRK